MPDLAMTHAMMASKDLILARTHTMLAFTWFNHLSMCLWSPNEESPHWPPRKFFYFFSGPFPTRIKIILCRYTKVKVKCLYLIQNFWGQRSLTRYLLREQHTTEPPTLLCPVIHWSWTWYHQSSWLPHSFKDTKRIILLFYW